MRSEVVSGAVICYWIKYALLFSKIKGELEKIQTELVDITCIRW